MGWSSGTTLFNKIIASTKSNVMDDVVRYHLYVDFIGAFEDADWDNIDECMGEDPAYDAAVKALYPTYFDEGEVE